MRGSKEVIKYVIINIISLITIISLTTIAILNIKNVETEEYPNSSLLLTRYNDGLAIEDVIENVEVKPSRILHYQTDSVEFDSDSKDYMTNNVLYASQDITSILDIDILEGENITNYNPENYDNLEILTSDKSIPIGTVLNIYTYESIWDVDKIYLYKVRVVGYINHIYIPYSTSIYKFVFPDIPSLSNSLEKGVTKKYILFFDNNVNSEEMRMVYKDIGYINNNIVYDNNNEIYFYLCILIINIALGLFIIIKYNNKLSKDLKKNELIIINLLLLTMANIYSIILNHSILMIKGLTIIMVMELLISIIYIILSNLNYLRRIINDRNKKSYQNI
ncbi:MAG: hypothetical protein PHS24_04385 [Bacilli bacterium]|nr:hypothetical protein [Bacilli bacterium]